MVRLFIFIIPTWQVYEVAFWIVALSLIIVEGLIVFFALRIKVKPLANTTFISTRPMEIIWTLLPMVLIWATIMFFFIERTRENT